MEVIKQIANSSMPKLPKTTVFCVFRLVSGTYEGGLGSIVVADHFVQEPSVASNDYEESTRNSIFVSNDDNVTSWMLW